MSASNGVDCKIRICGKTKQRQQKSWMEDQCDEVSIATYDLSVTNCKSVTSVKRLHVIHFIKDRLSAIVVNFETCIIVIVHILVILSFLGLVRNRNGDLRLSRLKISNIVIKRNLTTINIRVSERFTLCSWFISVKKGRNLIQIRSINTGKMVVKKSEHVDTYFLICLRTIQVSASEDQGAEYPNELQVQRSVNDCNGLKEL